MVELWPEASSASANRVLAMALPSMGESSRCASWISATCVWPRSWNTSPDTIRMAALTKKAKNSAITMSMVANLMASRLPATPGPRARCCTMDECR
jgi:hypothetical protein